MPFWAAALLFFLCAAASTLSFRKASAGGGSVPFFAGIVFALLGVAALIYVAATVIFVTSID